MVKCALNPAKLTLLTLFFQPRFILFIGRCGVERCFQEASARDPSRWRAKLEAALAFFQWENYPRAIERLTELAQLVSGNPFIEKLIGDCHRQSGELAAARQAYQRALARRRDYRPALDALQAMSFWGRMRSALARLIGTGRKR